MTSSQPAPHRPIQRGHLYLVPPLVDDGSATETPPSKPTPTFPWDIPATTTPSPWGMPPDDHHDHPPRKRVVWQRPTDQESN